MTPKQAPTPKSSKSKGGTKTFDFDSERSFESFVNEIEDHETVRKDFQEFFVQQEYNDVIENEQSNFPQEEAKQDT